MDRSPQEKKESPARANTTPATGPAWAGARQTHLRLARSHARHSPSAPPETTWTSWPRRGVPRHVMASRWPSKAQTKGLAIMRSSFAATTARWCSRAAAKGCAAGSRLRRTYLWSAVSRASFFALRETVLIFIAWCGSRA